MKRYAILIGSSRFDKEPKLKPLRCPENDVDGMHEILVAQELGAFTETVMLKNADHLTVIDQIEDTLNAGTNEDQYLIYYSGHGLTDLPGRLYLTTTNTQEKKLFSSSLPVESLRTMIENSGRRKIMLIFDCCYAGAAGKAFANVKSAIDEQLKDLSRGNGIYLLTASTANTTALEKDADNYSLLTKHIINGIKSGEAARTGTPHISIEDVYSYVHRKVTAEGHQEPMRWALNVRGEELVIAHVVAVFNPQRVKAFKELLHEIEDELDDDLYFQALRIVKENQQERDKGYFTLLNELYEKRLSLAKFSSRWTKLASSPSTLQPDAKLNPAPQKTAQTGKKEPPVTKAEAPPDRIVVPKSFTDTINGTKLEMILVPAGNFMMRSTDYGDEKPPHEVTLSSFYIGKYQITQAQWKAVMGDKLMSTFKGDNLPMESVSWNDAQSFCEKLSQMTNKEYRLPSEAEWEYACRAGTTGDYAGNLNEMAWYDKNSDSKTHPVGEKKPNAFGLYDMHGNVWEWCQDWYGAYESANQIDPKGPQKGEYRVLRGGSWSYDVDDCRSADRNFYVPDGRGNYIGFRVVVGARTA